jgi:hypothetical protein
VSTPSPLLSLNQPFRLVEQRQNTGPSDARSAQFEIPLGSAAMPGTPVRRTPWMWWRNQIDVVGGCHREASRTSIDPATLQRPKDKSSPSQLAALATDVGFTRRKGKSTTLGIAQPIFAAWLPWSHRLLLNQPAADPVTRNDRNRPVSSMRARRGAGPLKVQRTTMIITIDGVTRLFCVNR